MEQQEQPLNSSHGWAHVQVWTRLRDVLVSSYLVFLFHDLFIRMFSVEFLPLLTGVSLPPVPWRDALAGLLLLIGFWRIVADPAWRQRFTAPGVMWQVVLLLAAAAFFCQQASSFSQLNEVKGQLYPLLMFGAGIVAGYDWRKLRRTMVVLALINIGVAGLIALFWMDGYRDWITAYRTVFGESSALSFGKFEAFVLLPMPLILERTLFAVLFITAGAIAWYTALWIKQWTWRRGAYFLLAFACLFMVLGSFSRGGIVTMLMIYLTLYIVWALKNARARGLPARRGLLAITPALIAVVLVGLLTALYVRHAYGIDLLDPSNLVSSGREGRITIWSRVIDDIDRQQGWLTGIKPSFRTARSSIVFGARGGSAWSEESYYTVDNGYLYIVMQGGLFALGAVLAFIGIAVWQFSRFKCPLALALLAWTCLIWWMLATNSILLLLALLIGAGKLGDTALQANNGRARIGELVAPEATTALNL